MRNKLQLKRQSMAWRLSVSFLLVVILQACIFFLSLRWAGTTKQLMDLAYTNFEDTVASRAENINARFVEDWANPDIYGSIISYCHEQAAAFENGEKEDLADEELAVHLLNILHSTSATGAFVFFNEELSGTDYQPGFYLRNSQPDKISASNAGILMELGPAGVGKKLGFTLDSAWRSNMDLKEAGLAFYMEPKRVAEQLPGAEDYDYGYWSMPFMLQPGTLEAITYSFPVLSEDGEVIAVAGVETTLEYLKRYLPYAELPLKQDSCYMLGVTRPGEEKVECIVVNGPYYKTPIQGQGGILPGKETDRAGIYDVTLLDSRQHTVVTWTPLRLYNKQTPFEQEQWILCAILDENALLGAAHKLNSSTTAAFFISLFIGILAVIFTGAWLTKPVKRLMAALEEKAVPESLSLPAVNMYEIDQLAKAIENMSKLQELARQRVAYERDYDSLTGLMNRRRFEQMVRALMHKSQDLAVMVMWDLDNLKYINDTYGHDYGDRYIEEAAKIFSRLQGPDGIVARRSGDEFLAFLTGFTSREEYRRQVEETHNVLTGHCFNMPDGSQMKLGASGGMAWYPDNSSDYNELTLYTDFAMYSVKKARKGGLGEFSRKQYEQDFILFKGQGEFQRIIEERAVKYAFQPICDIKDGKVFAYEALMRPQSETLSSPLDFLRLAREQAKLYQAEKLTWECALESFQRQADGADYKLFVNSISNVALAYQDLENLEEKYGDLLKRVVIEVLENDQIEGDTLERFVWLQRRWQCELALDDFGTGYNSEVSLLSIQPAYLKIDMALIRDIHKNRDKYNMVENIISYAKLRKIKVIAEGVECEEEMKALIGLGADYVQGYYMGRPSFEIGRHVTPHSAV